MAPDIKLANAIGASFLVVLWLAHGVCNRYRYRRKLQAATEKGKMAKSEEEFEMIIDRGPTLLQQKAELDDVESRLYELAAEDPRKEIAADGERHEMSADERSYGIRDLQELRGQEHAKELEASQQCCFMIRRPLRILRGKRDRLFGGLKVSETFGASLIVLRRCISNLPHRGFSDSCRTAAFFTHRSICILAAQHITYGIRRRMEDHSQRLASGEREGVAQQALKSEQISQWLRFLTNLVSYVQCIHQACGAVSSEVKCLIPCIFSSSMLPFHKAQLAFQPFDFLLCSMGKYCSHVHRVCLPGVVSTDRYGERLS